MKLPTYIAEMFIQCAILGVARAWLLECDVGR